MIPPADHVTSILVTWSHRLITWSHRLIMWLPCWSHDPINWPYKTDLPQFTSSLPSPQSLSPSHTHSCLMHPTSTSGHLNWLSRHTRAAVWCVRTWNQNQMLRLNLYNNNPSLSKIIIKDNYQSKNPWECWKLQRTNTNYHHGYILIFDVYTPGGSPVQRWKPHVDCLQPHLWRFKLT